MRNCFCKNCEVVLLSDDVGFNYCGKCMNDMKNITDLCLPNPSDDDSSDKDPDNIDDIERKQVEDFQRDYPLDKSGKLSKIESKIGKAIVEAIKENKKKQDKNGKAYTGLLGKTFTGILWAKIKDYNAEHGTSLDLWKILHRLHDAEIVKRSGSGAMTIYCLPEDYKPTAIDDLEL